MLTGPEFRARVLRADGSIDRGAFAALWPPLRVMGRCSPQDKHTIVRGERGGSTLTPLASLFGLKDCPGSSAEGWRLR